MATYPSNSKSICLLFLSPILFLLFLSPMLFLLLLSPMLFLLFLYPIFFLLWPLWLLWPPGLWNVTDMTDIYVLKIGILFLEVHVTLTNLMVLRSIWLLFYIKCKVLSLNQPLDQNYLSLFFRNLLCKFDSIECSILHYLRAIPKEMSQIYGHFTNGGEGGSTTFHSLCRCFS